MIQARETTFSGLLEGRRATRTLTEWRQAALTSNESWTSEWWHCKMKRFIPCIC